MIPLLLLTAVLAPQTPAQPAATTEHPIAIAAKAFSACIQNKVMAASTEGTAEAGADTVMAACATEQAGLDKAVQAQIASAPADQQAQAREQYRAGMAQARQGIIEGMRARKSAASPTPAPSPTPGK